MLMYLKRVRRRLFTLLGNKYKIAQCVYNHCPAGAKRQFQRLTLFRPHALEQELGTWCLFGESVPKTILTREKSPVLCGVEGSRSSSVGCQDVMEGATGAVGLVPRAHSSCLHLGKSSSKALVQGLIGKAGVSNVTSQIMFVSLRKGNLASEIPKIPVEGREGECSTLQE